MGRAVRPVGRDEDQVATDPQLHVRPAAPDDVDAVLDLLAEAAAWTRARGFENWPEQFPRRLIAGDVERDELHVVERAGALVATLALQWRDELFWGADDGEAGYVHRLAVRRVHAGDGIGYRLLEWADARVRERGRRVVRLDVVSDNGPLRGYYEAAGFRHVRDLSGDFTEPDGNVRRWRTSLYERACAERKC